MLSGISSPELLKTYNEERWPIAWTRHQQIFTRPDYAAEAPDDTRNLPMLDDASLEFGQLYRSAGIIETNTSLPEARQPDQWKGQPGTRAPHLWINRNGERISTLDFFQHSWILLTAEKRWADAADQVKGEIKSRLDTILIGKDIQSVNDPDIAEAYGIGQQGACIIRPDGFIAWRSLPHAEQPENSWHK